MNILAGLFALFAGFLMMIFILILAVYIYTSLAFYYIAKKTKNDKPWLAWIPVANLYLMTQIAGVPWWTMLIALFAPLIPFIGIFVALAIYVWWMWKICDVRNKPGWWGLLFLVPLLNLIILGVLAWGD